MHLTSDVRDYESTNLISSPGIIQEPGVGREARDDHLGPEQLGGQLQLVVVNQTRLLCNQSDVSNEYDSQSEAIIDQLGPIGGQHFLCVSSPESLKGMDSK